MRLIVNGDERQVEIEPRTLLVHTLRDVLGLTGTKIGCEVGECGACTVLLGHRSVKSCMVLGIQAEGSEIQTIEGLTKIGLMKNIQKSFHRKHALQCGYCTPGMLVSTYALFLKNPKPSEAEVRRALSGNLCTCTGYENILRAVLDAAQQNGEKEVTTS